MTFIADQARKETAAAKRVWRGILIFLAFFWIFLGAVWLVSPAWPVGLAFIAASVYIFYRLWSSKPNA